MKSILIAGSLFLGLGVVVAAHHATPSEAATPHTWLAAGDSYSSGHGLPGVLDGGCQRARDPNSPQAWPLVANSQLSGMDITFTACSGDVTSKFWSRPQVPAGRRYDLVSFTFGGDNIDFPGVMEQCVTGSLALKVNPLGWLTTDYAGCPPDSQVRRAISDFAGGYRSFLRSVANNAVNAGGNVLVLGYPEIVEDPSLWGGLAQSIDLCNGISDDDARRIRGWGGDLNATIGQAVADVNAERPNGVTLTFVDVNTNGANPNVFEPSTGNRHNLCGTESWMNGLQPKKGFHPNAAGHRAMGNLAAAAIRGMTWPSAAAPTDATPPQTPPSVVTTTGSLSVSFSQNPFVCDGSSHRMGTLSGAAPGEAIAFTSPTVGGLLPGTADGSGNLALVWQCNPGEAGQSWQVTASGQSSGRTTTFVVSGARPTADTPPQTPPSVVTPTGSLSVSFSQNPFLCDGTSHRMGTLSGASPGESITFTSATVGGLLPGTADGSGNLALVWQCNPSEAGQSWQVTASGQSSGRTTTFVVTGARATPDTPPATVATQTWDEVAWGPPGSTVPLFSAGPAVNTDGSFGAAARIPVGSHVAVACRSYNQAIAASNSGGWWYRLASGPYAGYWTPASVYENGSGAYPATGGLWDNAVATC